MIVFFGMYIWIFSVNFYYVMPCLMFGIYMHDHVSHNVICTIIRLLIIFVTRLFLFPFLYDELQSKMQLKPAQQKWTMKSQRRKSRLGIAMRLQIFRKAEYRVVPNDSQIVFTLKTIFKKITNEFPPILRHKFFLQDYNMLYPRLDRVDILTGNTLYIYIIVKTSVFVSFNNF